MADIDLDDFGDHCEEQPPEDREEETEFNDG